MDDFTELFRGMGPVWAVWAVALAAVGGGAVWAARRFRRPALRAVADDECGASYSLGFVLVAPLYLCFLLAVYESTLLLVAKVGTMYAAHATARSAVVWQTAEPATLRGDRMDQAAFTAMAPFVGARARDIDAGRLSESADDQADEFVTAYRLYSQGAGDDAPADYLTRKYRNAASRTTYEVTGDVRAPNADTVVVLTYRAPLYIPGVSRFLDPDGAWPYEYPIESRAVLPNETPLSADRKLGIDYRSR